MRTGMIEVTVKRKMRKYKDGLLLASVAAPPLVGLLFLDVFAKHPGAALAYIIGMIVWDGLFAVANKKPRTAIRGRKPAHSKVDFRTYSITHAEILSNEEEVSA